MRSRAFWDHRTSAIDPVIGEQLSLFTSQSARAQTMAIALFLFTANQAHLSFMIPVELTDILKRLTMANLILTITSRLLHLYRGLRYRRVPIHILPGFTSTHSNAEVFNGFFHQLHISLSPQRVVVLRRKRGAFNRSMTRLNWINCALCAELFHFLSRIDLTIFCLFCCLTATISPIFAMRRRALHLSLVLQKRHVPSRMHPLTGSPGSV